MPPPSRRLEHRVERGEPLPQQDQALGRRGCSSGSRRGSGIDRIGRRARGDLGRLGISLDHLRGLDGACGRFLLGCRGRCGRRGPVPAAAASDDRRSASTLRRRRSASSASRAWCARRSDASRSPSARIDASARASSASRPPARRRSRPGHAGRKVRRGQRQGEDAPCGSHALLRGLALLDGATFLALETGQHFGHPLDGQRMPSPRCARPRRPGAPRVASARSLKPRARTATASSAADRSRIAVSISLASRPAADGSGPLRQPSRSIARGRPPAGLGQLAGRRSRRATCCSACAARRRACGRSSPRRSRTRSRFASASTSRSSACRRRRSWRRTPAASSNSGRRSSGRRASAWSTMPWPMNRKALSARLPASSRSTRSRRRMLLAVEQVLVLARAEQPPAELDLAVVDRQQPVLVVDDERHVGHAGGRACRRAGEDDVLRAARAQRSALLAERPAQRVGEVALAAAVGPDDGADARPELDQRRLGERLEADQAQSRSGAARSPCRPASRHRLGASPSAGRSSATAAASVSASRRLRPSRVPRRARRARPRRRSGCSCSGPSALTTRRRRAAGPRVGQLLETALGRLEKLEAERRASSSGRRSRAASRASPRARRRGRRRRRPPRTRRPGPRCVLARRLDRRPAPRRSDEPRSMRRAKAARPRRRHDRRAARGQAPFVLVGWRAYSASETTRAMTASPRNSRRSFERADASGCSLG